MNQVVQVNDCGVPLVREAKLGHCLPWKYPSIKYVKTERGHPIFEEVKKNCWPHKVDRVDRNDGLVGKELTDIVEATFDAEHMLYVKIEN